MAENSGLPKWLQDILDTGQGVFNRFADLELADKQLEIIRDARAFEAEQAREQLAREARVRGARGGKTLAVDNQTLLLLAVAGVGAAILIART
jgi:hypothetical protein